MGKLEHFKEVCEIGLADAVAVGTLLHYADMSISQIKAFAKTNNINRPAKVAILDFGLGNLLSGKLLNTAMLSQ